MPVTTPVVFIVPTAVLLLLHVPPAVALARDIFPVTHTLDGPVICANSGMFAVPEFHRSFEEALLPSTALIIPDRVIVPVPATGGVQANVLT
jgi:hypothetical protein